MVALQAFLYACYVLLGVGAFAMAVALWLEHTGDADNDAPFPSKDFPPD